ncbi:MAG TPA: nitroreductase [Dehalococcoidia bacterium]|nr:nitroreductase [Dehalococcoidia bacterium]
MDVIEAIHTRRTIKAYRPDPVPRELIERVLEAAVWAPNHRLTEPWEFVVVQGAALERLAALRREQTAAGLRAQGTLSEDQVTRAADEGYRKALAAPVMIAVAMTEHADPAVREEDYAATAAAIQNLMLAARGLGLGAFWSTNRVIGYPPARALLGVPEGKRIVGLVQLGYAAQQREGRRAPAAARTRWLT